MCGKDQLKCGMCAEGFYLDPEFKCVEKKQKFCYRYERDKCTLCESHFFLNSKNECEPCLSQQEECSLCTSNYANYECLQCTIGFQLEGKGTCKRCMENCLRCNEKKCVSCLTGYFWNEQSEKCEVCNIENCLNCEQNTCRVCKQGFFFDRNSNTCQKCPNNCLSCDTFGKKCFYCPVNYFLFQKEIHKKPKNQSKKQSSGGLFQELMGIFQDIFNGTIQLAVEQVEYE